jgi:hypothetical protein
MVSPPSFFSSGASPMFAAEERVGGSGLVSYHQDGNAASGLEAGGHIAGRTLMSKSHGVLCRAKFEWLESEATSSRVKFPRERPRPDNPTGPAVLVALHLPRVWLLLVRPPQYIAAEAEL